MKNLRKLIIVLWGLFILVSSCQRSAERKTFMVFPDHFIMEGFFLVDTSLAYCNNLENIVVLDSLLIVLDTRDVNQFLKIYNSISLKYISGLGVIGNGPNEHINPFFLTVDNEKGWVMFIDTPKSSIYAYKISNIIEYGNDAVPFKVFNLNPHLIPVSSYCIIDEVFLLLSTTQGYSLFSVVDTNGVIIKEYGKRDARIDNVSKWTYNSLYTNYFVVNREKRIIISGYEKFDLLQEFCIENSKVRDIYGENFNRFKLEISETGDVLNNYAAFYNLRSSGDLIYAPFLGGEFFDETTYTTRLATEVLVFDWEMKPVARFQFPVQILDFDLIENIIFVLTDDIESPIHIYRNPLSPE